MPIFQHGLTGERREVTVEEARWYDANPPWCRIPDPMPPEPKPPKAAAPKTPKQKA